MSFLERQVLSSRNVLPHPVTDFVFGGLNYQIEHHLFPTMPRVHFRRARTIVKRFMRRLTDGRARIDYLPLHGMNTADASTRQAFVQRVGLAMNKIT